MFNLLSTLANILSTYGQRFLDRRRGSQDAEVAGLLFGVVLMLQELAARGERILTIAERFVAGTAVAGDEAEFEDLLFRQVEHLGELRVMLEESRGLLATVDAELYFDLVPFLDEKSGLVSRWSKVATRSRFSTTTLFFLSEAELQKVVEVSREVTGSGGMELGRTGYLLAVADGLREARSTEIRDIRSNAARTNYSGVAGEIGTARTELARTRTLCGQLVKATSEAVGPDAMASLRRRLLPHSGEASRA
jgi:hypothetical protein